MENTITSKDTLDGINRLDIAEEKVNEFWRHSNRNKNVMQINSCSTLSWFLLLHLHQKKSCFYWKIVRDSEYLPAILTEASVPCTITLVNPCCFYRYWSEVHTHRKGSWHRTVFMTLGLRVSLLGNGPYVWLLFMKNSVRINEDSVTTL